MRPFAFSLIAAALALGQALAFEAGPKTSAHWIFDSSSHSNDGFKNRVAGSDLPVLPWREPPVFKTYEGKSGVFCSSTGFGRLPWHIDLTAGNSEKVISYGARIRLDTLRKDYSSFVAGFYDSHRFMVDTSGRFHLGIQNVGLKRRQQWLRTDSEDGQPLVGVKAWHEVVFTIDARDPGRVLGYFFLDGQQQKNPHFAVNDDGVRTTGMDPFQVCQDPGNAGPPWYNGPLHGMISELIIEKGYLIEPTLPHTGPLNNRVNLGTRSVSARPGDTLTVRVLLTNHSPLTLSSCQFDLGLKDSVAEVLGVKAAGVAATWTLSWNAVGGGAYRIALGGPQQPMKYGEGDLAELRIRVKPGAKDGDYTDLALDEVKLDENRQLEISTTTGRLRVEERILFGDADLDGDVDVDDAVRILAWVVEAYRVPDADQDRFNKLADVSGNGEVTSYDAALVLQHVAGLLPDFPAKSKPKALPKLSAMAGNARLAVSSAKDLGNGIHEYRILGENLHGLTGAELVLHLDPEKAFSVEGASTPLRSSRFTAARGAGGRYVITLGVTDRFQDFSELAVITLKQGGPGNLLALEHAFLNEGAITGDFRSERARGYTTGARPARLSLPSPRIRQAQGQLLVEAPGADAVSLTLLDAAGRPLLVARRPSSPARFSLEMVPRGVFAYEVRIGNRVHRGRAVRL